MTVSTRPEVIRIGIADDHPIFRDGLRRLLEIEPDMVVVGDAENAEQAVAFAQAHRPDILLLDLAMPKISGLEALTSTPDFARTTRVIVLTAAIDTDDMVKVLMLGARGIVFKAAATAILIEAIRTVMNGRYWIVREAVADVVGAIQDLQLGARQRRSLRDFGLTEREREIIRLVVDAAANKEIADLLGISEKTVKNHLTHIFDKLGVSGRLELAMFAIDHGLHARR
ncbi:MAG TPA: response regulator transcription factor [Vicinamibacterales bacterium]|nr:response regulator transcription factor [Vicinamibacterales bacterium]